MSDPLSPSTVSEQFEAQVHWQGAEQGLAGREYTFQVGHSAQALTLTRIKYRLDADTGRHLPCSALHAGELAVCNVATSVPVACHQTLTLLSGDRQRPLATVTLTHPLRRAENLHTQVLSIRREDRERLNGHPGCVLWFTGLSGAGKSTLANAIEQRLHHDGWRTYILDGDNVRQGLNRDLGFTDADRVENIRRIAEVARLMADAGLVVMTAFISPFRKEREMARDLIGPDRFLEVYVSTPLEVCEQRDVKGLYKKARQGLIPNMTGINSPYEAPESADVVVNGTAASLDEATRTVTQWLHRKAADIAQPQGTLRTTSA